MYQYALSGIDVKLQVEGRANVAEHLCAMSAVAPAAIAQDVHYYPTLKPDLVYVQYDLVSTDGTGRHSRPLAIIQMQDDQIISFTQLSRSPESLTAVNASMCRERSSAVCASERHTSTVWSHIENRMSTGEISAAMRGY